MSGIALHIDLLRERLDKIEAALDALKNNPTHKAMIADVFPASEGYSDLAQE